MSRGKKAVNPVTLNVEVLRSWMVTHSVKQRALAAKMDMTPEYFGKVLNGQAAPSLDFLARLGEATGKPWWTFVLPSDVTVVTKDEADAIRGLRALLRRELQPA